MYSETDSPNSNLIYIFECDLHVPTGTNVKFELTYGGQYNRVKLPIAVFYL